MFVVFVVKVGLTELGVGPNEDEEVLAVNIYKDLANCQLLNSYLYLTVKVLAHAELI